ncbi:MAG: YdcF family protein [Acidobacteria bacterium]|nr:YdcF family protein [Acidobacteriota bacterium]
MAPFTAPAHSSFWRKLGPGGLASLLLAAFSALALGLLPVVWRLAQVLRAAKGEAPESADLILVLGRRLKEDALTPVFRARLAHGEALWRSGLAPCVLVAGGLTGKATRSEAEAGRAWLLEHGMPAEAVLIEDQSQHTLENLFFVRERFREASLLLVSDPLHMARAEAFSDGLGLSVRRAPAFDCPPAKGSFGWWKRAAFEAFLLHWYRVGVLYSRLIGSKSQLERVR